MTTTRWRVTFEMNVGSDRDPREWGWLELLDVTDDVDELDTDSIKIEQVTQDNCDHPDFDDCGRTCHHLQCVVCGLLIDTPDSPDEEDA
jgi:hypothetical protein